MYCTHTVVVQTVVVQTVLVKRVVCIVRYSYSPLFMSHDILFPYSSYFILFNLV